MRLVLGPDTFVGAGLYWANTLGGQLPHGTGPTSRACAVLHAHSSPHLSNLPRRCREPYKLTPHTRAPLGQRPISDMTRGRRRWQRRDRGDPRLARVRAGSFAARRRTVARTHRISADTIPHSPASVHRSSSEADSSTTPVSTRAEMASDPSDDGVIATPATPPFGQAASVPGAPADATVKVGGLVPRGTVHYVVFGDSTSTNTIRHLAAPAGSGDETAFRNMAASTVRNNLNQSLPSLFPAHLTRCALVVHNHIRLLQARQAGVATASLTVDEFGLVTFLGRPGYRILWYSPPDGPRA